MKNKPIMMVDWNFSKEFLRQVVANTNEIIKSIESEYKRDDENGKSNME